jgi:hypothetical protein
MQSTFLIHQFEPSKLLHSKHTRLNGPLRISIPVHAVPKHHKSQIPQLASLFSKLTFKLWYNANPFTLEQSNKLQKFIATLLSNQNITAQVAMVGLLYLQRLVKAIPDTTKWKPQPGSELRMILTSLILADQHVNPNPIHDKAWQNVAMLGPEVIIKMKQEFMAALKGDLEVTPEAYQAWVKGAGKLVEERK